MALGARARACEAKKYVSPNTTLDAFGNYLGNQVTTRLEKADQQRKAENAPTAKRPQTPDMKTLPVNQPELFDIRSLAEVGTNSQQNGTGAASAYVPLFDSSNDGGASRRGRISPEDYAPSDRVGAHNSNNPYAFAALARKNAENCITTADCIRFSEQFSGASNGYFYAANLDQYSATERGQYKQLGNIYQQAAELANVRAANFAAADVKRFAQEPDWGSNRDEDVAALSAQTDRAMLASRLSTLNGQIIKTAMSDGTFDFKQAGKLPLYNINQIITPYVKASTVSAPPFEYSPGYYTSACTYEGCFGVRVAYISPAAISVQSDAYDRTHAGTNDYLASAERGMDRDLNIYTSFLSVFGSGFKALRSMGSLINDVESGHRLSGGFTSTNIFRESANVEIAPVNAVVNNPAPVKATIENTPHIMLLDFKTGSESKPLFINSATRLKDWEVITDGYTGQQIGNPPDLLAAADDIAKNGFSEKGKNLNLYDHKYPDDYPRQSSKKETSAFRGVSGDATVTVQEFTANGDLDSYLVRFRAKGQVGYNTDKILVDSRSQMSKARHSNIDNQVYFNEVETPVLNSEAHKYFIGADFFYKNPEGKVVKIPLKWEPK